MRKKNHNYLQIFNFKFHEQFEKTKSITGSGQYLELITYEEDGFKYRLHDLVDNCCQQIKTLH